MAALLIVGLIALPACTTPPAEQQEEEEEEEEFCSTYVGSGALDGAGIPPDFFTDLDVRKGFCYAFDYETYIRDGLQGQGEQRGSPVVEGLPYYNPDASKYEYDLDLAELHLKAAWGGDVWEKGFKFTLLYNSGNIPRKTACEILAEKLYGLNPLFEVSIQPISWPTFLGKIWGTRDMPMFQIGWLPDYPHPDNFIVPFMESTFGAFSHYQAYGSPALDTKITAAFAETDPVAARAKYYELQEIYYQDPGGIMLAQPIARRYFTDHISGFYYNPVEPNYIGRVLDLTKADSGGSVPFNNPGTFVFQTIGPIKTLDPAWIYDTASAAQTGLIYDPLLYFDGESSEEFIPQLATEWEFNSTDLTFRFKIREGVKFTSGNDLTPEDVEYTFERWMVMDRSGGPTWMIFGPLLDVGSSAETTIEDIMAAVEVDGDSVVFHLGGGAHWELAFLQIYYQDPGGIMLAQPIARRYFTDHISGFYYNPVEPNYIGRVLDLTKADSGGSVPFNNPGTFVFQTIGPIKTLDPAWIYDTASAAQTGLIYDPLLYFDGESSEEFIPQLATEWEFNSTDLTFRFKIREGVKFTSGNDLTPEDVEYTFERWMVMDRSGGPTWMIFGPLLDVGSSAETTIEDIMAAVEVDGDSVVFHLGGGAHWELAFLQILCGGWAGIVDKDFTIANGGWDATAATWMDYNVPDDVGDTVLYNNPSGTGPWKLNVWEPGIQVNLQRNDDYWGGSVPFDYVITQVVEEWTSRKLALLAGDADLVYVPATYFDEMDDIEAETDLTVYKDLPSLSIDAFFFNMLICG